MAIFIGINILVSVSVTLIVLNLWDAGRSAASLAPTVSPQAIAVATTLPTVAVPSPTVIRTQTYLVQSGDTLSSISRAFDVPLQDLLTLNHLTENDVLSVGQALLVPAASSIATVPPTKAPVAIATSTPTASSAITQPISADVPFLTIREIVSSGDLENEAVVVTNLSGKVDLAGWTLADSAGHKYTFPDLTLLPNAEVNIHTTAGTDSSSDLYWGETAALWSGSGTIAYLRDANGKLIATYRVP
jgi:murein DD-endopeptidase MepM/ murein hydrolase activator NlpD